MITAKDQVKIMDFGLAKLIGGAELTKKHSTLGTAAYMSPEQACGDDIDHRTDTWSFGVVFYEMLTGRMPFQGEYDSAIIYSILNDEPAAIKDIREDIPYEIEQFTYKCLQKDKENRYPTSDSLLNHLKKTTIAIDSGKSKSRPKKDKKKAGKIKTVYLAIAVALLLILSVFIVTSLFQEKIEEPIITQVKPLTTTASILEVDPDISPDGSKVTYVSDENENLDIWVHEIASGKRLNITQDYAGNDGSAKWSPDGNWISFFSSRDGGGIYLISEFGGNIKQIVSQHDTREFGGLNWSLDNKRLVYAVNNSLNIVTVNDRSKSSIPLPHNCSEPAWSPEGDRIVYISKNDISSQIWTVKLDDANPILVFEGSGIFFTPLWSSDGKRIFFKWLKNGIRDLWWIPVDKKGNPNGSVKPATTGWDVYDFSLSSDGTKLAYCKAIQRFNIWSIPLKNDRVLKMDDAIQVTFENQTMNEIAISPDYEFFAFTSTRNGMNDIWIIRRNGKDLRQLTADSLNEEGVGWSPDGSRIAYHAVQNKNSNIYTVSIVGGAVRTLIRSPANDSYPSWSATGDSIIFQSDRSGNQEIWMTSLRDSTIKQLTNHKDYDGNASFSSDGASIAFVSNRSGSFEIYIASLETGEKRKLTNTESDKILKPIWSPNNRTIYISYSPDEEDRSRKILEVAVKDGATRKIFDFKGKIQQLGPAVSLARDNERLYFVRQHYVADIWLAQLEYK